jgi:hypothetical protein
LLFPYAWPGQILRLLAKYEKPNRCISQETVSKEIIHACQIVGGELGVVASQLSSRIHSWSQNMDEICGSVPCDIIDWIMGMLAWYPAREGWSSMSLSLNFSTIFASHIRRTRSARNMHKHCKNHNEERKWIESQHFFMSSLSSVIVREELTSDLCPSTTSLFLERHSKLNSASPIPL